MSQVQIDEVQMAVVEACISVIEDAGAPDREVQVLLEALGTDDEPKGLEITIQDGGMGLPHGLSVAGTEENSKAARRRRNSLRIIAGLMDAVDIRSDTEGTTVVMRKMR